MLDCHYDPMKLVPLSTPAVRSLRTFANRLGHDIVWLAIAILFCTVEAVVVITELRFFKRWHSPATSRYPRGAAPLRPPPQRAAVPAGELA